MNELLGFFSLAAEGDVPVGLNSIRVGQKRNQPVIKESLKYSFVPLFSQNVQFNVVDANGECLTEYDCGAKWLNYINHS
ncbi:MAG: hypothetical protein AB7V50_09070 [Vampirovibrionia bacterium]